MSTETVRPTLFLKVHVRVRNAKRKLRIWLPPIAIFAMHYLLLSCDPLMSLIPGAAGIRARSAMDALDALLLGFMASGPLEFVNADVRDGKNVVKVSLRTI